MPSSTDCWGIEIGANAVKAVRLTRSGDQISLADFEVIPHKKVLTAPDVDADESIRIALQELQARHNLSKSTVIVSVAGHMAFARFAKLPPVEPKKIPDIVKFEAVQQIPFPIEQVEWDYQTFEDPDSPDVEVGIFAITRDRLTPYLHNIQQTGLPVHGLCLAPVAIFNALIHDQDLEEAEDGTILMDIGTSATDLIVVEGGRAWLRTIPIGGNHFTEALVRSFKLSFSKAEKLKREAASSKYARQIFHAMRPVFVDLVQEVQKSLGYYQSLHRDTELTRLIGLGSTFRLPGLQTFLKQQLQLEVTRLDAFNKIEAEGRDASTFADNTVTMAPAYGLALQGLGLEKVRCNLLPAPVVRQQVWKAKQPWFIAAAAGVLIATGLAWGDLYLAKNAYESAENESARREISQITNRASEAVADWNDVEAQQDPRQQIGNIMGMLDYREVWPAVVRDLDEAILAANPQPALLEGDIEQIAQIPRNQRRIVFIDEMQVEYRYQPGEGPPAPTSPEDWEENPPYYRVVVTGVTPHGNTAEFLERNLIQYLKDNGEKPGREYRIADPTTVSIAQITDREADEDRAARPARPTGNFIPGMGRRGAPTRAPQGTPTADLEAYLPEPPAALSPQPGDFRFTIEWRVELRPPESDRQNQTGSAVAEAN
jgi:type IV pilus assembly protein PilM